MPKVLISLDEIDRVKRLNRISTNEELATQIGIHRNTLRAYLKSRKLDDVFVNGLVRLGARPTKILVLVDETTEVAA